jgi:uncharacterized protein YcnI
MKFRGWSSRSIWVCSVALATLVLAPAAAAHLSIDPSTVVVGQLVDLTFNVPNQDDAYDVNHVTLGIPADFQLDDAEAKPGWTQSRTQQAITWSGGLIPKGQYATFSIRGTAPARAETVLFNVLVGDRTGQSITYHVPLEVAEHATQDNGARTLGKAALVVAIVAGVLALGAGFLGLYLWLRPPRPEDDLGEV